MTLRRKPKRVASAAPSVVPRLPDRQGANVLNRCGVPGSRSIRVLFAVRGLVAEGSVEQAIATLQAKKQAMTDAVLDEGATGPLYLGAEDLAALLRPLASWLATAPLRMT